MRHQGFEPWTP